MIQESEDEQEYRPETPISEPHPEPEPPVAPKVEKKRKGKEPKREKGKKRISTEAIVYEEGTSEKKKKKIAGITPTALCREIKHTHICGTMAILS